MDTTDSDIVFDDFGFCNHCHEFKKKEDQRKAEKLELPWVYHQIRKEGKGKTYDVLIGLSGGVDSSLCLHYLVENGIRVLAFTIDNGWNTKESDENIMRLVEGLKIPFYRYNIDLEEFRELQVSFMKSGTANIEIPTDHILMAASYQTAKENNIKFIVSGGNIATEAIMPKEWGYEARDLKFIKAIYKKFANRKLINLPMISLRQYLVYRFVRKIKVINLLDYYEYNREKAKKLLHEKYRWLDYGEKHCESTFTWWFQHWYLPQKFGYDKRKPHYSSMILSGQMRREDAMQKLLEPLTFPVMPFQEKVKQYPIKGYRAYSNNEKMWSFLSKTYGIFKKR